MEEAKGLVKHVLLAKFKDDIPPEKIEQLIKGYAKLVSLVEPMKSFHWGTDVSKENLHQGFTHVFESTFESVEGVAEYVAHPAHVEFSNDFLAALDKVIVIDYKPTQIKRGLYVNDKEWETWSYHHVNEEITPPVPDLTFLAGPAVK